MANKIKGYPYEVAFYAEQERFVGTIHGLTQPVHFMGETAKEFLQDAEERLDSFIELRKSKGLPYKKDYSGKFNLRLDPEMHQECSEAALEDNVSLNEFCIYALEAYLRLRESLQEKKKPRIHTKPPGRFTFNIFNQNKEVLNNDESK